MQKLPPPQCSFEQRFQKFEWTKSSQVAFDILKEKLLTAPVLNYPDTTTSVILTCDASDSCRNFMSKLVYAVCEIFDITQHHTTAYHPKTNGAV